MKPFDLERAKAGDPLMYGVVEVLFIGMQRNGKIVTDDSEGYIYSDFPEYFSMAPKKRTFWLNFYPGQGLAEFYPTETLADLVARERRVGGKAYPVEIEE